MMDDFKNRVRNNEILPPAGIWNKISTELENNKIVPIINFKKRSKIFFYAVTAAASLIIIFVISLIFNKPANNSNTQLADLKTSQKITSQQIKDSFRLNNKTLEAIIKSSKNNETAGNSRHPLLKDKKYITIEGPQGEPVRISSKAATLIVSADNEYPPKPVWNKKIEKWKQIMLSNIFSPTSTSLMDIAKISATADNSE